MRGVTLIEILIYMALLAALLATSFSMAFTLGRDRDILLDITERQTFGLAFFEAIRKNTNISGFKQKGTIWIGPDGHEYIYIPQDIIFYKPTDLQVDIMGSFILRETTSRDFTFQVIDSP